MRMHTLIHMKTLVATFLSTASRASLSATYQEFFHCRTHRTTIPETTLQFLLVVVPDENDVDVKRRAVKSKTVQPADTTIRIYDTFNRTHFATEDGRMKVLASAKLARNVFRGVKGH